MTPAEPDNNDPTWYVPQPGNQGYQPPGNHSPGTDWNPYQASWTESSSVIVQSQAVSALSILSLISGILSVPLICLCFLSIPFSLFAIVAGHISRGICRRSQGRVTGDGMAVAGLVLGYVSLLVTTGIWVIWIAAFSVAPTFTPGPAGPPAIAPQWNTDVDATQELDRAIGMVSFSLSAGNSDAATQLAQHLQAALHDISQQLKAGGLSAAGGVAEENPPAEPPTAIVELPETSASTALQQALEESSVYCSVPEDSCAFLVTIRNWTELNDADRKTLSQMIWLAAGRSADGHLGEGDAIAVALVSNGLIEEISLGNHERSDHFDAGLRHRGPANAEERRALEQFFEPVSAEAMPDALDTDTSIP